MAIGYKRKYTSRRRPVYRKRKVARKAYRPMGRMVRAPKNYLTTKRFTTLGTITGNPGAPTAYGAQLFKLSDVTNYTEFTALFDQYRILGVGLRFILERNTSNSTLVNGKVPRMYMIYDKDTSSLPTMDELRQADNCKIVPMDHVRPFTYFCRPNVLGLSYQSVTSAYTPKWKQWISTSESGCPHYGVRYAIENLDDTDLTVRVEAVYYMQFKSMK